jgi:preprotein translocase subunit SecE
LNDLWNNKFSKFIQDTVDAYEKIIWQTRLSVW